MDQPELPEIQQLRPIVDALELALAQGERDMASQLTLQAYEIIKYPQTDLSIIRQFLGELMYDGKGKAAETIMAMLRQHTATGPRNFLQLTTSRPESAGSDFASRTNLSPTKDGRKERF